MTTLDDLKHSGSPPPTRQSGGAAKPLIFLAILAIVLGLGWKIFGDALSPRQDVEVGSVLLLETESQGEASASVAGGKSLAQASGWIEPDAFPVNVAAQTSGTLLDVAVLSGESVTNGQVLAQLNPEDAKLAVESKRSAKQQAVMDRIHLRSDLSF